MDIPFDDFTGESCRHPETENCQTEGPFDLAFRPSDIFGDSSFQQRPTVDCADAAMDQQCRDSGSHPFIFDIVHFEAPLR